MKPQSVKYGYIYLKLTYLDVSSIPHHLKITLTDSFLISWVAFEARDMG